MKICQVSTWLPGYHKTWGGAEQAALKIIELLFKNNHQVTVLSTKPTERITNPGFDLYKVSIMEDYWSKAWYMNSLIPFDLISYFSIIKILKKSRPQVIHFQNFLKMSYSVILAAKQLRIPIVVTVLDYRMICPTGLLLDIDKNICHKFIRFYCIKCYSKHHIDFIQKIFFLFKKCITGYFVKLIDCFIVLSESSKSILIEYGIKENKIKVIPLPLADRDEEKDISQIEKDSILFVGWINYPKGLHVLIEVLPGIIAKVPGVKLSIIETGVTEPYKDYITGLINKHNLNSFIYFLGKKSNKEVKEYIKKANVIVIPEQWENTGSLFLGESLLNGKAVVASKIGGFTEYIQDNISGLLCDPRDPNDFADKIVRVLNDDRLRMKLSLNAKKKAQEIFDEENILKSLLGAYNQLCR